jgi:8-oxo-dGTP diphosphatase
LKRAGTVDASAGIKALVAPRHEWYDHARMQKLADIDWEHWQATDEATLLFVLESDRVLLMHKKRGLGAGKINAPGGRLEPGETAEQGAVREVQEELRVTPTGLSKHGELSFQFTAGYSIFVHVFLANGYQGTPEETSEARPLWTPLNAIPYERMWADDSLWVPLLLARRCFCGRFLFNDEQMLDHQLLELASSDDLLDPRGAR